MKPHSFFRLIHGFIFAGMLLVTLFVSPSSVLGQGSAVITYQEAGTQRIYAFRPANTILCVNYWDGAQWKWAVQGYLNAPVSSTAAVVTFSQADIQRIYAFVKGSNGHLYVNYWDGSQWQWADQGMPPGTQVLTQPEVITYSNVFFGFSGTPQIYAFVQGLNKHLYVNYWDGSQWKWADHGTPPGTMMDSSPAIVTYREETFLGGTRRIYAFVRGSNGHLYVNYLDGSQWKWADQGAPPDTQLIGHPLAISFTEAGTQRIYAFVTGFNTHLYVNYWDGSQWHWADQGAPPGDTPLLSIVGITTFNEVGTQKIYAFFIGANNHLYVHYWDGSQWHWADQGAPPGISEHAATGVISYYQAGTRRIYAFLSGANNHLYLNYWDGSQWHWADQGAPF